MAGVFFRWLLRPTFRGRISQQPASSLRRVKRLPELSVAEAGPGFVKAGLITNEQLEDTRIEMRRLADDECRIAFICDEPGNGQ